MTLNLQPDLWLPITQWVPSPNCDLRPQDMQVDLLVIHSISLPPCEFGGPWIDDLLQNRLDNTAHLYFATLRGLKVSCHLLIRRDGTLIQYVPLAWRAWHAGVSNFQHRTKCNDFSIGIELEGCDSIPFTPKQYQMLVTTTNLIREHYPAITLEHIVGHQHIAPERKTDPGPLFAWNAYFAALSR